MSDWRPLIEALPQIDAHGASAPSAPQEPMGLSAASIPDVANYRQSVSAPAGAQSPPQPPAPSQALAHDEKLALARAEAEALALRYRAAIDDLVHAREQVIKAAEADMVRLALTIAKETLMSDVTGREQFTSQMVEHALSLLGQSPSMTLRIAPRDLFALKQHKPELLQRQGLHIVEDETLSMGGCVVDGTQGRVDASMTARLASMAKKLLGEQAGAL